LCLFSTLGLATIGCVNAPGHPGPGPEIPRPDQVLEFATLYAQNCAGCHGVNGKNGVAASLADPVYLAIAGAANVREATANGVAGHPMPAFDKSAGGSLTGQQMDSLVQGMFQAWGSPNALNASVAPAYAAATTSGDPSRGQHAFAQFCSHCHGVDGSGAKGPAAGEPHAVTGSIADPSYLALLSDQSLRTTIIAGRPDQGMPDWRSDISGPGSRAMTDQEISDIVAWLAAQRTAYPGQPDALGR
jgi:cytochrome c oxidase cbb3-type subunit 3/ubiquinol-cytochrome c reductase cytochrome c subunit